VLLPALIFIVEDYTSLQNLKILVPFLSHVSSLDCESCQLAKHHRMSYSLRVDKRVGGFFDLAHFDVWKPCPLNSKTWFRYFITFVDDYSCVTWLYLMKNRLEVFSISQNFCAEIEHQFGTSIHVLRSDNAKEFFSSSFVGFMRKFAHHHVLTLPLRIYKHQPNLQKDI